MVDRDDRGDSPMGILCYKASYCGKLGSCIVQWVDRLTSHLASGIRGGMAELDIFADAVADGAGSDDDYDGRRTHKPMVVVLYSGT